MPSSELGECPSYIQGAPELQDGLILQVASEEKPRWMWGEDGKLLLPDLATAGPSSGGRTVPQVQLRGGNLQLNDPGADFVPKRRKAKRAS
jgi:hypothetical protein